ncbi:MAG: hypothetical protein ACRCYP_03805 [Alphaproteobacteria bacterium]
MTNIRDLLTDPEIGLLPYLENILEQNFHRFQLRRYFPGERPEPTAEELEEMIRADSVPRYETAGFRLRDGKTKNLDNSLKISSIITIGKVLTVKDQVESQIIGEEIRVCIDQAIAEWSRCVGPVDIVEDIDGAPYIEQDPNQDSGNEGAWSIYIVREFTLTYDRGHHEGFPNYDVVGVT